MQIACSSPLISLSNNHQTNMRMYHPRRFAVLEKSIRRYSVEHNVSFLLGVMQRRPAANYHHGNYEINFYHGICRINKTFSAFTTSSLNELANFFCEQPGRRVTANCLKCFGIFGHVLDTDPSMFVRSYRMHRYKRRSLISSNIDMR